MDHDDPDLRSLTADIVAAYVGSRNHVAAADLPSLIGSVHAALTELGAPPTLEPVRAEPAMPLRKAVQADAITCLFDGKRFKSLKRHLATEHQMTPAEYRAHWGLPKDSPMVAPDYANARSTLARAIGLGRKPVADNAPVALAGRDAPPPGDATPPVQAKRGRGKSS